MKQKKVILSGKKKPKKKGALEPELQQSVASDAAVNIRSKLASYYQQKNQQEAHSEIGQSPA